MSAVSAQQSLGKRDNQEDGFRIVRQTEGDPASDLLMLLADGMGGHAGGEVASRVALDAFAEHFVSGSESRRPRERLQASLRKANDAVGDRIAAEPGLCGMGCTLIGCLKVGDRLVWVSVGDSMLLLYRDGALRRLNADHSVYGELKELVAQGKLTDAEARRHPRRNALRSAVVGGELPLVDLNALDLARGDLVLLASDGLESLSDGQIEDILRQGNGQAAEALVATLIASVEQLDRPHQDNTTVLAYRHGGVAERSAGVWPMASLKESGPPWRTVLIGFGGVVALALAGTTAYVVTRPAPDEAVAPPVARPATVGEQTDAIPEERAAESAPADPAPQAAGEPIDSGPAVPDAQAPEEAVIDDGAVVEEPPGESVGEADPMAATPPADPAVNAEPDGAVDPSAAPPDATPDAPSPETPPLARPPAGGPGD